jgi:hypothetical protein
MFNWLTRKPNPKYQPEGTQDVPAGKKEEEKPETAYYRLGITDRNRVSLKIGYGEITMNPQGVQNLIDQLELFKLQIMDEPAAEKEPSDVA